MNPEIKTQWVAALRSGEYRQGTGELHALHEDGSESFCCLGVLCDLAVKAHVIPEPTYREFSGAPRRGNYRYGDSNDETKFGELPETVMTWAEIETLMGSEIEQKSLGHFGYENLAAANDDGMSFEGIAGAIEEWL